MSARFSMAPVSLLALVVGALLPVAMEAQDTTSVRPVTPAPGPIVVPVQGNVQLDSAGALFDRAASASSEDAEDAYRHIVVEYPASPHAEEALLRLSQLELARGDRVQATSHLNQLTRDHTLRGPAAASTEFAVGEAYFQLDDLTHACPVLTAAKGDVAPSNVELANRINYALERCRMAPPPPPPASAALAPATRALDSARTKPPALTHKPAPVAPPPAPATTPHKAAPAAASAVRGGFTVQVAALNTRAEADSFSHKLAARGYDVRVVGTQRLFRVRVGRYRTEAQAGAERAELAAHGVGGFVTAAEP